MCIARAAHRRCKDEAREAFELLKCFRNDVSAQEKEAKKPVEVPNPLLPPTPMRFRQVRSSPEGRADEEGGRTWSSSRPLSAPKGSKKPATPANYRFGSEPSLAELQERLDEALKEEERLHERLRELEHQLAQACGSEGEEHES